MYCYVCILFLAKQSKSKEAALHKIIVQNYRTRICQKSNASLFYFAFFVICFAVLKMCLKSFEYLRDLAGVCKKRPDQNKKKFKIILVVDSFNPGKAKLASIN